VPTFRLPAKRRYFSSVITSVLGAPGSGKSTIAPALAGLLPGHADLDWDAFMEPAAALAGREIPDNPETWPAYRELVHAVIGSMAHLPVVLLGVCTPELNDWPIDAWVFLDCTDQERQQRLGRHADPQRLADAIRDGREYRHGVNVSDQPPLPVTHPHRQPPARNPASSRSSLEARRPHGRVPLPKSRQPPRIGTVNRHLESPHHQAIILERRVCSDLAIKSPPVEWLLARDLPSAIAPDAGRSRSARSVPR
jgi:energy-coupling factor transporter ATP-binding protein EcfA2